jgi:hypothetical protein
MNYENLPVEKLVAKLIKTQKSINAHVMRGNQITGQRSLDLLDRYQDIRGVLRNQHFEAWKAFCDTTHADYQHDGYDLFA